MKSRVVLLSDITTFGEIGISRYMGPYAIGSALESAGFEVVVVDYMTRVENFFTYLKSLLTPNTLAVGISSTFMCPYILEGEVDSNNSRDEINENYANLPILFREVEDLERWLAELRNVLNSVCPDAKIIVGGAKVQSLIALPTSALTEINYYLWGNADTEIVTIMRGLEQNRAPAVFQIDGKAVIDNRLSAASKKDCPPCTWSNSWAIQQNEALSIEISRGCVFNCKFCHYDRSESFRKTLETLRAEFIRNYEDFGTTFYHFCDDCFNDHREKVEAITTLIKSLPFKIEWISYARVDVAVKFPETVRMMVESGARGLYWGLESFNYEVARRAGKGTPTEKVKAFLIDFMKDHGDTCYSQGSFIAGLPGETVQSQRETINWVSGNEALHFMSVGPLSLIPYRASFDKSAIDYAEYSRNPKKYGFSEISFNPPFWKHDSMDRNQAVQLTKEFVSAWKDSRSERRGLIHNIWNYPHLRSLGYSADQVSDIYFSPEKIGFFASDVRHRFSSRLAHYFSELQDLNRSRQIQPTPEGFQPTHQIDETAKLR